MLRDEPVQQDLADSKRADVRPCGHIPFVVDPLEQAGDADDVAFRQDQRVAVDGPNELHASLDEHIERIGGGAPLDEVLARLENDQTGFLNDPRQHRLRNLGEQRHRGKLGEMFRRRPCVEAIVVWRRAVLQLQVGDVEVERGTTRARWSRESKRVIDCQWVGDQRERIG